MVLPAQQPPYSIFMSHKNAPTSPKQKARNIIFRLLGPGLVTGAADDDPSGIATYSQAGAQFGYGLLWTVFLTTPFMIAIQLVSAHIGRVTGKGIAANAKQFFDGRHCRRTIVVATALIKSQFHQWPTNSSE